MGDERETRVDEGGICRSLHRQGFPCGQTSRVMGSIVTEVHTDISLGLGVELYTS